MTVSLVDATPAGLQHIVSNLRERDREEILATRWTDTLDPQEILALGAFQWVAEMDGTPVASIGAYPVYPNVWSVWAFGTDDWPRVVLTLSRHVRRFMIPGLKNAGATRAQCLALSTHQDARKWLEFLGAEAEATLAKFGKNGQDFVMYRWLH